MFNPSTVWASLATPNAPASAIPFIGPDNTTPEVDVLNFAYSQGLAQIPIGSSICPYQLTIFGGIREGYSDTTTVPGAAVINKPAGRVKFAIGAQNLVVTNSYAFATSMIDCRIEGAFDATATTVQVSTQINGSFTLSLKAATTAACIVSFNVRNVF